MNALERKRISLVVKIHITICTDGSFGSSIKEENKIRK